MKIEFFMKIGIKAQRFCSASHHGKRRLNRLLHDVPERTGFDRLSFTLNSTGLNGKKLPAD